MTEKIGCNRENGAFSELWGRNCWVADSVLTLIMSFIEPGEWHDTSPGAQEVCQKVEAYCQKLRLKNKEPHFDDVIWTDDRPV